MKVPQLFINPDHQYIIFEVLNTYLCLNYINKENVLRNTWLICHYTKQNRIRNLKIPINR